MSKPKVFVTITEDQVKLLNRMQVMWIDGEYGAPAINPKRPYGNSAVESDICEILGWKKEGDDGEGPCWSSVQRKRAEDIHTGMEAVLPGGSAYLSQPVAVWEEGRRQDGKTRLWLLP